MNCDYENTIVPLEQFLQRESTGRVQGEYREKSITLDTYVDGHNAGYFAWVKRKSDGQQESTVLLCCP